MDHTAEAIPPALPKNPGAESAAGDESTPRKKLLEGPANAVCIEALHQLRIGLSQARLYGPDSPQFLKIRDRAFAPLPELFKHLGQITISIVRGEPLVNACRLDLPANFRATTEHLDKVLQANHIQGLCLEPELTVEDLGPLLALLAHGKVRGADAEAACEILRQAGIRHVRVQEVTYAVLTPNEIVVDRDTPALTQHAMAQQALTELVDSTLRLIDTMNDPVAQTQLRSELCDQLVEKDAAMLPSMLAGAAQHLKTAPEEAALPAAIPRRDAQQLNELLDMARMLGVKDPDPAAPWRPALVRMAAQAAAPYRRRAEEIAGLLKVDAETAQFLPDWLNQAREALGAASAQQRLQGILAQSPEALLNEQVFPKIIDVLDELSVARMDPEAQALADHVAGALRVPTRRERAKAAQRLSEVLQHCMEQSSPAVQAIENAFLETCPHETSDEVMALLVRHLKDRCVHHYQKDNHPRALEHLEWLTTLEESSRLALREEGANLARQARDELAQGPFAQGLAGDVRQAGPKGDAAAKLLKLLGPGAWAAVLDRISLEADENARQTMATRLGACGPAATEAVLKRLSHPQAEAAVINRLLACLPRLAQTPRILESMPSLLAHPDTTVRQQASDWLVKNDSAATVAALGAALDSTANQARRDALISALSKLRDLAAIKVLLRELARLDLSDPAVGPVATAVLETLGQFQNESIVPPIRQILLNYLTALDVPDKVKTPCKPAVLAAIKALGNYFALTAVAGVLERLRHVADADVARTALVCQRGLLAGEAAGKDADTPAKPAAGSAVSAGDGAPLAPGRPRIPFETDIVPVDHLFKAGAAVKGASPPPTTPAPAVPPVPPLPAAPPPRTSQTPRTTPAPSLTRTHLAGQGLDGATVVLLPEGKPDLEGSLEDLNLTTVLSIAGHKDGMLVVAEGSENGRIYIKDRKIVNVRTTHRTDLPALRDLCQARGRYAYYHKIATPRSTMNLDIDKVAAELKRFRPSE